MDVPPMYNVQASTEPLDCPVDDSHMAAPGGGACPERPDHPVGFGLPQGQYSLTSPTGMLAGVSMALLPVTDHFLFGRRYIVEGVTLTGLKGKRRESQGRGLHSRRP